jgi:sugar phosphate isomerase/epimerase
MSHPPTTSRRVFLQSAAALGAVATAAFAKDELLGNASSDKPKSTADSWHGLKLGVASYSLRGMKLDDAIAAIQRVGLSYVSIKDTHLPLKSTTEERKAVAAKFKDAGITPLSVGVITMQNEEANCRAAFEYARDVAVPVMVCNPHPESFPILDKLVKEFDLKLAIHNHGPESDRFKSPFDAMNAAEKYDQRIGVCVDVGHTARMKIDPADAIRKCAPRLYDVHLKDLAILDRPNNGVPMGRGVLDVRSMLRALLDINFAHHAGIEYEDLAKDPLPGLAESVGYLRGVMSGLGS